VLVIPLAPELDRLVEEWIAAQPMPPTKIKAAEEIVEHLTRWLHDNGFHDPLDN